MQLNDNALRVWQMWMIMMSDKDAFGSDSDGDENNDSRDNEGLSSA